MWSPFSDIFINADAVNALKWGSILPKYPVEPP